MIYDMLFWSDLDVPTFMKKVGTGYVWLFAYVYADFRLLGPGKFKILKGVSTESEHRQSAHNPTPPGSAASEF